MKQKMKQFHKEGLGRVSTKAVGGRESLHLGYHMSLLLNSAVKCWVARHTSVFSGRPESVVPQAQAIDTKHGVRGKHGEAKSKHM
jgi:hypothetical protein